MRGESTVVSPPFSECGETAPGTREPLDLYTSNWVTGTRAAAYFGPISTTLFVGDAPRWGRPDFRAVGRRVQRGRAILKLLDRLRAKASTRGANAVVAVEVTLDPFARSPETQGPGMRLHVVGTAARLEPTG